jgi:regulator of protease activity HflC (stomatin/prohibitin superfamily)
LRKAVAARTLDELLGDKATLDAEIFAYVRGRVEALGIEVLGVGVKDVILPGEMREILNGVVQAEKLAQANVIRRREEANATRSLLNTAKLIDESPVLMRLKELEALEKVTEKIDRLTVFGGLDGVVRQLVTMK